MAAKLELYRVFREVAACGSISEAAKNLYLSQSAVSQSIKQMERQLGSPLFHRLPKGVKPTREGELLLGYASSALDLLEAGEQRLQAMRSLAAGDLKIAASDTISRCLLLPGLERFHARYPAVQLQIVNRTTLESVQLLKSGKVDLAYVNLPLEDRELLIRPRLAVEDVFVAAADAEEYQRRTFTLPELARLPLILLETKSNSRRYVDGFFQKHGLQIQPEIELGSHELLLEFARIRLGVSCVIREFSAQYLESGALRELSYSPRVPQRQVGVASLRGVALSSAARCFEEIVL